MSAPLRIGTYARWRKIREIFLQVAENSDWTKKHNLKGFIIPKKDSADLRKKDQSLFKDYRSITNIRCSKAMRSVLVRCKRDEIAHVLKVLQRKFGYVVGAYYYPLSDGQNSLLVEFPQYTNNDEFILNDEELEQQTLLRSVDDSILQKVYIYQHEPFQIDSLMDCSDVSDQIMHLSNGMQLSRAKVHQHFYVGIFVRKILRQLYPSANVHFFGSSACGLATDGKSDLDLVILYNGNTKNESVLSALYNRMHLKKYKEFCSNLSHIRFARVPILKFDQKHTGMSCDVSYNTLSGIMMAEMLCWLRVFEPSFQPLVMTVKLWAKNHNLVGFGPGGHFSNHMLTMMVVAFLQKQGCLPPLQMAYVNKDVLSTLNHGNIVSKWNDVMLKDPRMLVTRLFDERPDLGSMLYKFFKFYSSFQFDSCVMNILYGKVIERRHQHNIYICNPFENKHNMCQNVQAMYVDKFQYVCQRSVRILDIHMKRSFVDPWGLMCIMTKDALRKHQEGCLFSIDWAYDTETKKVDGIVVNIAEDEEDVNCHVKPSKGMKDENELADKYNIIGKKMNKDKPSVKPLKGNVIASVSSHISSKEEIKCQEYVQSKEASGGITDQRILAEKPKKKKTKKKKKLKKSKEIKTSA